MWAVSSQGLKSLAVYWNNYGKRKEGEKAEGGVKGRGRRVRAEGGGAGREGGVRGRQGGRGRRSGWGEREKGEEGGRRARNVLRSNKTN